MSNEHMRSEIQERFKQVEDSLQPRRQIMKWIMGLNAGAATLQIMALADKGCEMPTVMKAIGFSAFAIAIGISSKDVVLSAQNNQLLDMLFEQDKPFPKLISQNRQTQKNVFSLLKCSTILTAGSWVLGGLNWSSLNFAMGSIFMCCLLYNNHLEKKNRKVLSAEFPKGVIDARTR